MGDWLHDKLIPWKAHRLCKRYREMGLGLLGGNPDRGTTGPLQISVCRLQVPTVTGVHNQFFQQVQEDMSKTRLACKDWDFVSRGTEISVGRFLIEYFTPLTKGEEHLRSLSDEDASDRSMVGSEIGSD